ncbi:MAG: PAS domain S-box protein, partial [Bryobacterales bacterium]|nr:PAS domain S-box protein [Bryobacterales bacterium]
MEERAHEVLGQQEPMLVVGIGASAGGLEALQRLFDAMPANSGMAFVVIQHLSPDFHSMMDELLSRHTAMKILSVTDHAAIERDTVYLLTPGKQMVATNGFLQCYDRPTGPGVNMPINIFLHSLAAAYEDRAACIILSGTGSDGMLGVQDVYHAGGLVLVQNLESARFDGMPKSAIGSGKVHAVLPPEEMPAALVEGIVGAKAEAAGGEQGGKSAGLPEILERLNTVYGLDFGQYKRGTISRRILRRMSMVRRESIQEYTSIVLSDTRELDALYCDLLIGVTTFFRDPEAFEQLEKQIAPRLLKEASGGELRLWVAGCATGEEAYSMAMMFLECADKLGIVPRLKIFATDVHRVSLEHASIGWYPAESVETLSEGRRKRFFTREGEGYRVNAELRNLVLFTQHNLLRDPPFTKMSLVSCRNVLIYFQPEAQRRALLSFQFALKVGGVLFLGPSEGAGEMEADLSTLDRYWKLYRKERDTPINTEINVLGPPPLTRSRTVGSDPRLSRAYETVLQRYVPSGFLLNEYQEIIHVFGEAHRYLTPTPGRMRTDVLTLTGGDMRLALSSALHGAQKRQEKVVFKGVRIHDDEDERRVTVAVDPLPDRNTGANHYLVLFEEGAAAAAEAPPDDAIDLSGHSQDRLIHLERELQHTRESLQSTVEELESSNEELQASNQELVAANEELQSVNEELHSLNQELYSVNSEYQQKILELNQATNDLENLMQSTEIGTVFLDRNACIRLFTVSAGQIFNLIAKDMGRDIRHIRTRIQDEEIFAAIEGALERGVTSERTISGPEQRYFLRKVTPYRGRDGVVTGAVITLVDITWALEAEQRFNQVFESVGAPVAHVAADGRWLRVNPALSQLLGYTREQLLTKTIQDVTHAEDLGKWRNGADGQSRLRLLRSDGTALWLVVQCSGVESVGDARGYLLCTFTDVTRMVETEQRRMMGEFSLSSASYAIAWTSDAGKMLRTNAAFRRLFGYSEEELRDVQLPDLVPLSGRATWADFWLSMGEDTRHQLAALGQRKNGSAFAMEVEVTPFQFEGKDYCVLFVREVADAVDAQGNGLAPCGLFSLNREGALIQVNTKGAEWIGLDRADLLGKPLESLLTAESRDEWKRQSESGDVVRTMDLDFVRKDGSTVSVQWHAAEAHDASGQLLATHGTICPPAAEQLRRGMQNLPAPIVVFRADLSAVLYASRAAEELLGIATGGWDGMPVVELFDGCDGRQERQTVTMKGNGGWHLDVRMMPLEWAGEPAVMAVLAKA